MTLPNIRPVPPLVPHRAGARTFNLPPPKPTRINPSPPVLGPRIGERRARPPLTEKP
jgi:hypothetical protein